MSTRIAESTKESIRNYILNRPGEYISTPAVGKMFGVSSKSVQIEFRKAVAEAGGVLDVAARKGYMFTPVAEKKDEDEELKENIAKVASIFNQCKPVTAVSSAGLIFGDKTTAEKEASAIVDAMTSFKNHEGYSDPTAAIAIASSCAVQPGDVWEAECSNGYTEDLLILAVHDTFAVTLKVYDAIDMKTYRRSTSDIEPIMVLGVKYFIDIARIGSKPLKYIKSLHYKVDTQYMKVVKDAVSRKLFGDDERIAELEAKKEELDASYLQKLHDLKEKNDALLAKEEELRALEESLKVIDTRDDRELTELRVKVGVYERLIFERGIAL